MIYSQSRNNNGGGSVDNGAIDRKGRGGGFRLEGVLITCLIVAIQRHRMDFSLRGLY